MLHSDDRVLLIPVLIDGALTVRWRMRQTLLNVFLSLLHFPRRWPSYCGNGVGFTFTHFSRLPFAAWVQAVSRKGLRLEPGQVALSSCTERIGCGFIARLNGSVGWQTFRMENSCSDSPSRTGARYEGARVCSLHALYATFVCGRPEGWVFYPFPRCRGTYIFPIFTFHTTTVSR